MRPPDPSPILIGRIFHLVPNHAVGCSFQVSIDDFRCIPPRRSAYILSGLRAFLGLAEGPLTVLDLRPRPRARVSAKDLTLFAPPVFSARRGSLDFRSDSEDGSVLFLSRRTEELGGEVRKPRNRWCPTEKFPRLRTLLLCRSSLRVREAFLLWLFLAL